MANGKAFAVIPASARGSLLYVEGLNDARTTLGKWRVSARRGWAGEKSDFFSILLEIGEPIVEVEHIQCHASAEGWAIVLLVDEVVPGFKGHG